MFLVLEFVGEYCDVANCEGFTCADEPVPLNLSFCSPPSHFGAEITLSSSSIAADFTTMRHTLFCFVELCSSRFLLLHFLFSHGTVIVHFVCENALLHSLLKRSQKAAVRCSIYCSCVFLVRMMFSATERCSSSRVMILIIVGGAWIRPLVAAH